MNIDIAPNRAVLPVTGLTGDLRLSVWSAVIVLILGLVMLFYSVNLYNKMNVAAAKQLFTVSILYLTLLQITYLIDKMYLWT
jgi:protoheme IX farnesyltransferase